MVRGAEPRLPDESTTESPTRERIHQLLLPPESPRDAAWVAARLGLNHTTVRAHLGKLIEDGLVVETQVPPTGRGRPRRVYHAVERETNPYRTLSLMLADAVRLGLTPRDAGRRAGEQAAAQATNDDDAATRIAAEATRLGFAPRIEPTAAGVDVVLGSCPFADVAAVDPATVCELHLGLAEGVVAATGGAEVDGLRVADPREGGCRIVLRE